jgi:undecaprenyl-phosphate glucose phosphotransferase
MLRNRQEGLTTLHGIWVTIIISIFFLCYVRIVSATGLIELLDQINYNLYFLCVFGGMLITLRTYQAWGQRLGNLSAVEATQVTIQQILRLSLILFAAAFATKDGDISRLFLGSFLGLTTVILFLCNFYLPGLICRIVFKAASVPTLFIGSSEETRKFSHWIDKKANLGVEPVGLLSDEPNPSPMRRMPLLGGIEDLDTVLAEKPIGQIILLQNYLTDDQTKNIIDISQQYGCRIRIYNNWEQEYQHPIIVDHEGEYTFFTLQNEPLENPVNRSIKRLFDVAFSLPVVAFLLPPLMLLVWFFQRRQAPGPLFYTQPRTGLTKHKFNIIKFRTMYHREQDEAETARQASSDDDRIYSFGRFMRRTSMDEIPQFINVLLGDMSISGPRPHLIKHDQEFSRLMKTYYTRHFVKPGITGLAQCKGFRGEISELGLLEERIKYDIFYINHWSLLLDLQIVLATVKQVIFPPKSAY